MISQFRRCCYSYSRLGLFDQLVSQWGRLIASRLSKNSLLMASLSNALCSEVTSSYATNAIAVEQRYLRNLVVKANNSQHLGVYTHFCGRCT